MKKLIYVVLALMLVASVVALNYRGSINVNVPTKAYQNFQQQASNEGKTPDEKANELLEDVINFHYITELEEQMYSYYATIHQTNDPVKYEQAISCLSII